MLPGTVRATYSVRVVERRAAGCEEAILSSGNIQGKLFGLGRALLPMPLAMIVD